MAYRRSLEIESRLDAALELIRSGQHGTPALAEKLGVSIPTVSRCVTALRERGHRIRSQRTPKGWRYLLEDEPPKRNARKARGK